MEDGVDNGEPVAGRSEASAHEVSGFDRVERRETGDGSATLFSSRYGQTFHSHHGAVAEARHVFVEGSGTGTRLRGGEGVRVLEVGFGTGLNFLLTAQQASAGGTSLSYVALERELLPATILASLDYQRFAPEPFGALQEFRARLPKQPQAGRYSLEMAETRLELRLGPAETAEIEGSSYDAIYHDAFSPDVNPELWTAEFLTRLALALTPGGALVTYTVKGEVRRLLATAGLMVSKEPGPSAGKREMLRAVRSTA